MPRYVCTVLSQPLLGVRYAYYNMWVWQGKVGYRSILETERVGRSLFVAALVVLSGFWLDNRLSFMWLVETTSLVAAVVDFGHMLTKEYLICQTYPLAIKNVHLINKTIHVVLCNPRYQMSAMRYLHASMYLPHTWNHITLYGSCY